MTRRTATLALVALAVAALCLALAPLAMPEECSWASDPTVLHRGCDQALRATILAQLQAEGRVDWDTPLGAYLPDLNLTDLVVVRGQDRGEHIPCGR
jgi:hypothetical protein